MSVPDGVERYFEMRDNEEAILKNLQNDEGSYFLHGLIASIKLVLGVGVMVHCSIFIRRRCFRWYNLALIVLMGLFCTVGTIPLFLSAGREEGVMPKSALCSTYGILSTCTLSTMFLIAIFTILRLSRRGREIGRTYVVIMASITFAYALFMLLHDLILMPNRFYPKTDYVAMQCGKRFMKMMWIVCEARPVSSVLVFGFEYLALYIPHFTMFVFAVYISRTEKNKWDELNLYFPITDHENPDNKLDEKATSCHVCGMLRSLAYWIVGKIGVMIFVVRPIMIGDLVFTNKSYVDIVVPLSVLILYDLVCIDYILCMRRGKPKVQAECILPRLSNDLPPKEVLSLKEPTAENT